MKKPGARPGVERRRVVARREPYSLILIVCEGSVTEPAYFVALCDELKLSTANIVVAGEECGSSPVSVFEYAVKRFKENPVFDEVYCVFDKDEHARFNDVVERLRGVKLRKGSSAGGGQAKCTAITSAPCFEVWVLLHFIYSARPFVRVGQKTASAVVLEAVREHFPSYNKGMKNLSQEISSRRSVALKNAVRLANEGIDNPRTNVNVLVDVLERLKAKGSAE